MPRFTEADAECRVLTFKEGLLSAVAHDLELAVERFSLEWDQEGARLEGRFDPASLRVLHACKDGAPNPGALSEKDRRKIEATIQDDVLQTRRHGEIVFTSAEARPPVVRGTLTLCGRSRPIEARVRQEGERWIGQARLHQPDFGIAPYSAMMGTLRIKPDVEIRIRAPR